MVSLAEKMAANLDMSAFGKAEELKKRLWFTVLALIVFRLGTFIPLPGIDPKILADIFRAIQTVSSACSTCLPAARLNV